jgi:hypothetical protein
MLTEPAPVHPLRVRPFAGMASPSMQGVSETTRPAPPRNRPTGHAADSFNQDSDRSTCLATVGDARPASSSSTKPPAPPKGGSFLPSRWRLTPRAF